MTGPMMQLTNVTKLYSNDKGITNINLSIHTSKIHCLVGVNGAGKTTLINVLLNQLKINKGKIEWFDSIIKPNSYLYKKQIGYVPDDEILLENLTPMEIVQFAGFAYGLNKDEITKKATYLFELLELNELHTNVNTFSRGMKKKVQLVTALLGDIKLLILDEPTAGFDPNIIYLLKNLFLQLKQKGVGIIISTHNLDFAHRICDDVTIIDQGKVITNGQLDKLLVENKMGHLEDLFISKTKRRNIEGLIESAISHL